MSNARLNEDRKRGDGDGIENERSGGKRRREEWFSDLARECLRLQQQAAERVPA